MIKGRDIFKPGSTDTEIDQIKIFLSTVYDAIEELANIKIAELSIKEGEFETESEGDRYALIVDYKFRAQETLENAAMIAERLALV